MRALGLLFVLPVVACVTSEATPPDAGPASDLGLADGGAPSDGGRLPSCADLMPIDMGLALGGGDGFALDLGFALTVGDEDPTTGNAVATEWHDGDTVTLAHGLQGGWMVTPSIDVDTTAPVPTSADGFACFDLYITNTVAGAPGLAPTYAAGALAVPVAGRPNVFHVATQLDFLDYVPAEVDGRPLTLDVHVVGPTGDGRVTRMVTPRSTTTGMP